MTYYTARPHPTSQAFQVSEGGLLPTGSAFQPALIAFLHSTSGAPYRSDVGFEADQIRWVRIRYKMTILTAQGVKATRDVYDAYVDFVASILRPATLSTCFPVSRSSTLANHSTPSPSTTARLSPQHAHLPTQYAGSSWLWMTTYEGLVKGMFYGFYVCFPIAFSVLVFATGSMQVTLVRLGPTPACPTRYVSTSLQVSSFAILAIIFVVGSLLGFVKVALNWSLGTNEGIAGGIVIGLAVDYVVHIASAYTESEHVSRDDKVLEAVGSMGVTVLGGARASLTLASPLSRPCLTLASPSLSPAAPLSPLPHPSHTLPRPAHAPPSRLPHASPTPPSHLPHISHTPPSHLPHTSLTPPSQSPMPSFPTPVRGAHDALYTGAWCVACHGGPSLLCRRHYHAWERLFHVCVSAELLLEDGHPSKRHHPDLPHQHLLPLRTSLGARGSTREDRPPFSAPF